jgi:hypothetical protein
MSRYTLVAVTAILTACESQQDRDFAAKQEHAACVRYLTAANPDTPLKRLWNICAGQYDPAAFIPETLSNTWPPR